MSIPPLVCSTPPPPEQCEEDKDTGDFELQYHLSNSDDEDSNEYNYGNFTTYNHMETPVTEIRDNIISTEDIIQKHEEHINVVTDDSPKPKVNNEEEINIEDLNLEINQDDPVTLHIKDHPGGQKELQDNQDSPAESTINTHIAINDNVNNLKVDESVEMAEENVEITSLDITQQQNRQYQNTEAPEILEDHAKDQSEPCNSTTNVENTPDSTSEGKILHSICENEIKETNMSSLKNEDDQDDDDDFDDFQFTTSAKTLDNPILEPLDGCENPWGNEDEINSGFGNFANFDNSSQLSRDTTNVEHIVDQVPTSTNSGENDDDFGDFDDFKSSATEVNEELPGVLAYQQVSGLHLPSPDNESQVIENINKVLSSIFEEEILETAEVFQGKLDLLLSETWGHLMEIDVRQPYIVNWNNSLAQKTLLRALCIDSRNILYGPKWSNNMPKFAANLSTAPLQPQKQSTSSSISQSDSTSLDKVTPKSDTWIDPFASNGQESCSSENDNAVIEPRPTDLDVFEASMPTKSEKIYSNTISVQPLRQINLPDTHIFTPTDSETPRSKTIHYDCGPPPNVLIPQPADNIKSDVEKPMQPINNAAANNVNDSDYWEFQDFKGSDDKNDVIQEVKENTETNNAIPKPNVVYQTQLLQPIRVDPIIPTLNWPDPGEVKETFDDFSEFISNCSINTDKQDSVTTITNESTKINHDLNTRVTDIEKVANEETSKIKDSLEDDFDTFQSALPTNKTMPFEANFGNLDSNGSTSKEQNMSSQARMSNFDSVFTNNNNIKADDISFTDLRKPTDTLPPAANKNTSLSDIHTSSPVSSSSVISRNVTNILQPTPTNLNGLMQPALVPGTVPSQQNTTQILQPLSLESYSQINWPNPGIDLQDLSRFNPVETLPSLKNDISGSSNSKGASPVHNKKNVSSNQVVEDDIWGEFVSSKPKQQPAQAVKKASTFHDDDEWTDFVSSPSVKPQNGLNTISLNVHTNLTMQNTTNQNKFTKHNTVPLDIPSLNYITPKTGNHKSYNDKHFQNL